MCRIWRFPRSPAHGQDGSSLEPLRVYRRLGCLSPAWWAGLVKPSRVSTCMVEAPTPSSARGHDDMTRLLSVLVMALMVAACSRVEPLDVSLASLSEDGGTLYLTVGACIHPDSLSVGFQETADRVLVEVRGAIRAGLCGLGVPIVLAEPLEDRRVVDAFDGLDVPVSR